MRSGSSRRTERLRILVLGYLVRSPLGGHAWHHLNYIQGLIRLGHDVVFLEDSGSSEWACYDPSTGNLGTDPAYGLNFVQRTFERLGLDCPWAYYDAHTSRWLGPGADDCLQLIGRADLLLNVSNVNVLRPWTRQVPKRVLVDTDPVFQQVDHLLDPAGLDRAWEHNVFFTFGANIGRPDCAIPDDGLPWRPTRQPVVLDAWPVTPGPRAGRFTSVMRWESYAAREYAGRRYGMKSESFGPYLDLPRRAHADFELSLGGPDAPRELLLERGWRLSNPLETALDPWVYQEYLRQSKAEFSIAKEAYVSTRCGWFSDRTVSYLASGRPALAQETGFSDWLPTGTGLLAFSSLEEAIAGVADIDARYEEHCKAARAVVEDHFNAAAVLSDLIEQAMNAPSALGNPSRKEAL